MPYKQSGYVVLLTTVILSFAGILYTSNMVSLQVIDNKVLANQYRSSEAFVNSESGVNLILNKLSSADMTMDMLNSLPFSYPENRSSLPYIVKVDRIGNNKLSISSIGRSLDNSAFREISLQVYYNLSFNVPDAPLLSNGKLLIDAANSINDGCEGLSVDDCSSPGSVSNHLIISNPRVIDAESDEIEDNPDLAQCLSSPSSEQSNNVIANQAIQGQLLDSEGHSRIKQVVNNNWGKAEVSAGEVFNHMSPIANFNQPESLFEYTFATKWSEAQKTLINTPLVADIDMTLTAGAGCAQQLKNIEQNINVIYIKGDCEISASDLSAVGTFTIGSTTYPKMLLIDGGKFITSENAKVSVNGILYLLPKVNDIVDEHGELVYVDGVKQTYREKVIDLAKINVNGSLLSEYDCSISRGGLSVRYDKDNLNRLYQHMGMAPASSRYQLVAGSWRDF